MKKLPVILFVWLVTPAIAAAAIYPLEITAPQPSLNTHSRWYKAYPGIEYRVPVGVYGGQYPFVFELTTAPSAMAIDQHTGIITWANPTVAGSPHSVTVSVTDDESTTVTRSWTITVSISGFIFIDSTAGEGGDGTLSSPFNRMGDFYGAAYNTSTYDDYFVYWRGGIYGTEGYYENSGQQYQLEYRTNYKPHVWLGYPGETVVIDFDLSSGSNGAFLDMRDSAGGSDDAYFGGIKFQDGLNHFFRVIGDRTTWFDCEFDHLGPGIDGHNSSMIMYASTLGINGSYYSLITHSVFANLNVGTGNSFIKLYSTTKQVIADNSFATAFNGTSMEGVAIKAYDEYGDLRANRFDGIASHVINGNYNICDEWLIRHNLVLNANSTDGSGGQYGALTLNYNVDGCGSMHVERNTFEGVVIGRYIDSDDGPFYFKDNVIVNEETGEPDRINCWSCADETQIIISASPNDNLVGSASDNIIDSNGLLTGTYRTDYLGRKGHEVGPPSSDDPPSNDPDPTDNASDDSSGGCFMAIAAH